MISGYAYDYDYVCMYVCMYVMYVCMYVCIVGIDQYGYITPAFSGSP